MNIFNQIFKSKKPSEKPKYTQIVSDYGVDNLERDHALMFQKAVDEYKKSYQITTGNIDSTRYVLAPNWYIYATMYGNIDTVAAAVNFKADSLPDWIIRDETGKPNEELKKEIEKRWNLTQLVKRISKQYDIYSTVFYLRFIDYDNDKPVYYYKTIPASEILNIVVNLSKFRIDRISWNDGRLYNYRSIDRVDNEGNRNFYIGRTEDTDDLFIGSPRLRAMFTTLDGKLRDDENYQLFLKNSSFPGIIALVPENDEPVLMQEIDSAFRAMRDPDQRFKAQSIRAIGDLGNGTAGKKIELITIDQRIENRLSLKEKQEIDDKVKDSLGIPREVFGHRDKSSGAGSSYEESNIAFRNYCLMPQMRLISRDLNGFFIEEMLKELEAEDWFEKKGIFVIEKDEKVVANHTNFTFGFEEVEIELPSEKEKSKLEKQKLLLSALQGQAISAAEWREMGLEIEDEKLNADFHFTLQPMNINRIEVTSSQIPEGGEIIDKDYVEDDTNINDKLPEVEQFNLEDLNFLLNEKSHKWTAGKTKQKIKGFFAKAIDDNYSKVPYILNLPEGKELVIKIQQALDNQIKTLDIESILDKIDLKKVKTLNKAVDPETVEIIPDPEEDTFRDDIEALILAALIPLEIGFIAENLISALVFYARLGQEDASKQAINAGVAPLTVEQLNTIRTQSLGWIDTRVKNLLGYAEGETTGDIMNPNYIGNLNKTSAKEATGAVVHIISTTKTASKQTISKQVRDELQKRAKVRAQMIAENNIAMSYDVGIYTAAQALGATTKTWLRTVSKDPRPDHLEMIGETVPLNSYFSNGENWTNILPKCKCGIKLAFKTNIEKGGPANIKIY